MITLIDGSNMLHRAMYDAQNKLGIHPLRELYVRFISGSSKTMVIWDGMHSNKRRRDVFPGYKTRPEKGDDIKAAFELIKEVLCHTGVTQMEVPYWEADDVLYTLALECLERGDSVSIETNDQDFWQLADRQNIRLPLVKPLPCPPDATCVYKALVGDKSDSIPGWRGFGPARFEQMLDHFNEIKYCLKTKDWNAWQQLPWPKGLTVDQETFFQCCIYLEVVTMMEVPSEEFEGNFIVGKSNPALVEEIFARWRI